MQRRRLESSGVRDFARSVLANTWILNRFFHSRSLPNPLKFAITHPAIGAVF
jgi:hypothetical protein